LNPKGEGRWSLSKLHADTAIKRTQSESMVQAEAGSRVIIVMIAKERFSYPIRIKLISPE
jgi:hypothetical protein